jgi:hypothetical protein
MELYLVQFPELIRVQIDSTEIIQDERKSEFPRIAFRCQIKVKNSLQFITVDLKRDRNTFKSIIKSVGCKMRYLHKFCWETSKWHLLKDLA